MKSPFKDCVYCASPTEKLESEHVFPASWYPDGMPVDFQHPTVPSCSWCNRRFKAAEERILRAFVEQLDSSQSACRGIPERVQRSMDPSRARDESDAKKRKRNGEVFRAARHVVPDSAPSFPGLKRTDIAWIQSPQDGHLIKGYLARDAPIADLHLIAEKFVKGLHYTHQRNILPRDCMIRAHLAAVDAWPDLMKEVAKGGWNGVKFPTDCFVYTRAGARDDCSIWLFFVWKKIFIQATCFPPDFDIKAFMDGTHPLLEDSSGASAGAGSGAQRSGTGTPR